MSKLPATGSSGEQPSDWNRAIRDAQRETQAQAASPVPAAARRSAAAWLLPVLAAALVLATASLAWWLRLDVEGPPTPAELDAGRRALLKLVDQALEDHLRLHGDYPETLEQAMPLPVDVRYRRGGAGYELSVRLSDGRLVVERRP